MTASPQPTDGREALLPCPFCGKSDLFVEREDFTSSYVMCNDCSARGPAGCQDGDDEETPGKDAAGRVWNARSTSRVTSPDGRELQPTSPLVDARVATIIRSYLTGSADGSHDNWLCPQDDESASGMCTDMAEEIVAALSAPRAPDTSPLVDGETNLEDCKVCGGSGFSGRGTGYDDVCGECGGLKSLPAQRKNIMLIRFPHTNGETY